MTPFSARCTPSLARALQNLHDKLACKLRSCYGPHSRSFVITSSWLSGFDSCTMTVYSEAGQELWPVPGVSENMLDEVRQEARSLHSVGHWMINSVPAYGPSGWRPAPRPAREPLPW